MRVDRKKKTNTNVSASFRQRDFLAVLGVCDARLKGHVGHGPSRRRYHMVQAAGPLVDSITDTQAKIRVHEGAITIHPFIIIGKVLLDYQAE